MDFDYEIITDASIDIDADIAKEFGLRYLPMGYLLDEELKTVCEPAGTDELTAFYDQLRNKVKIQTSQINPYTYIEAFRPFVLSGKKLIYVGLSSGLSATCNSASDAVRILDGEFGHVNIEVVDSLGATVGIGLLVEAALRNRAEGMGFKENAAWMRRRALNVVHQFKVVDLFYLMRGGRVSAASAALGTALNLRPILVINNDGRLETVAKKRGDGLALKHLVSKFEEKYNPGLVPNMKDVVYVCHAGCPDAAEELKKALLKSHPDLKTRTCMLSPIIGAHTGPDMLGMTFFGNSR